MEKGYEDIYSDEPYLDIDGNDESKCLYIDLLYVPPQLRGKGEGKRLVNEFLNNIPESAERVRLKACSLGSGYTGKFWEGFGFKQAYYGALEGPIMDLDGIMVLGVNGFQTPPPERLTEDTNEREMHESSEDLSWIESTRNDSALNY